MAVKFLGKQYGLSDVSDHLSTWPPVQAKAWMKMMADADDGDGTLDYEEFSDMVRKAQGAQEAEKEA